MGDEFFVGKILQRSSFHTEITNFGYMHHESSGPFVFDSVNIRNGSFYITCLPGTSNSICCEKFKTDNS